MKNILLSIIWLTMISLNTTAEMTFNYQIPQPNLVTNDWDGDGLTNDVDTDDDGDNIPDTEDDNPFSGRPVFGGSSSTPTYEYTGDTCEDGSIETATVDVLNQWLNQNYDSNYYCDPTRKNWWIYSNDPGPIPEEIAAISQMEHLANNGGGIITELPDSIAALKNLKILEIRDQGLTSIPTTIGALPNIEKISFRSNDIVDVPASLGDLTSIKSIELWGNNISVLPNEINNLPFSSMNDFYIHSNPGAPFSNLDCSAATTCTNY